MKRENQFKVLLSDPELAWVKALAGSAGITASAWVRARIRREHRRRVAAVHRSKRPRRARRATSR